MKVIYSLLIRQVVSEGTWNNSIADCGIISQEDCVTPSVIPVDGRLKKQCLRDVHNLSQTDFDKDFRLDQTNLHKVFQMHWSDLHNVY